MKTLVGRSNMDREALDKTSQLAEDSGYDSISQRAEGAPSGLSILVLSSDLDKVLPALIIANGAVAMEMQVTIFFAFWGINALRREEPIKVKKGPVEHMFGIMMPRGLRRLKLSRLNMAGMGTSMMKRVMKSKNVYSLERLFDMAAENGVEFIACTMSMDMMGIRKEELRDGVNLGGVARFLESADQAKIHLIF
jgi:peroxiredoxin family protein